MKFATIDQTGTAIVVRSARYDDAEIEAPDEVQCGWVLEDGDWTEGPEAAAARRDGLVLTPPQFRKMLRVRGIKANVEAAIAAIVDADTKADYEDWYNYLPAEVRRTAPRIDAIRTILSISAEDADTWFAAAMLYE